MPEPPVRMAEAARLLEAARPRVTGLEWQILANAMIRWWLARIYVELGRTREAERYYKSLWQFPRAVYELGKLYEEVGEFAKARETYELVLQAWQDADPQLDPRVEEVRAAIKRLTSVIRECPGRPSLRDFTPESARSP